MPTYSVQVYHEIWEHRYVEAASKSEARRAARNGEGEVIGWDVDRYNVRAASAATVVESMEPHSPPAHLGRSPFSLSLICVRTMASATPLHVQDPSLLRANIFSAR